ncbi:MAG TPA: hypothetical protein VFF58_00820 [Candidatus Nitrosotalea sp.]|nr:hypothetical protein [Candidatus Nitrosotalea sp.]
MRRNLVLKVFLIFSIFLASLVALPRPAACEQLDDAAARALTTRLQAAERRIYELNHRQSALKGRIDELATYRSDLFEKVGAGRIASKVPLQKLDDLRSERPLGIARGVIEDVLEGGVALTYDASAAIVRANLRAGKATDGDARSVKKIEDYVVDRTSKLDSLEQRINGTQDVLSAFELVPAQGGGADGIADLMTGQYVAQGRVGEHQLGLGVTKYDQARRSFEGTMTYIDNGVATKVVGWEDGVLLLFRETAPRVRRGGLIGRIWRLKANNMELAGNVRDLGIGDLSAEEEKWPAVEDGEGREQTIPPPPEGQFDFSAQMKRSDNIRNGITGPAAGTNAPARLVAEIGTPDAILPCTAEEIDSLSAQNASYSGSVTGNFLGRDGNPMDYVPILVRLTRVSGGAMMTIQCMSDDMAGVRCEFLPDISPGRFDGIASSQYLKQGESIRIGLTVLGGGAHLVGTWRNKATYGDGVIDLWRQD